MQSEQNYTGNGRPSNGARANGHVEGGERVEVRLVLDMHAPGAARSVVADCLGDRVASSVFDNAQLLMSELVTR